jgi:hypothetical protein
MKEKREDVKASHTSRGCETEKAAAFVRQPRDYGVPEELSVNRYQLIVVGRSSG